MTITKANLLCGTGTLYIGPVGEPLPEKDDLAPPLIVVTPGGNWVSTGSTQDTHEFVTSQEREPVFVNESRINIKNCFVKEGGTFGLMLAEKNVTAIAQAMSTLGTSSTQSAAPDVTAQDIFTMGDKATPAEVALLYMAINQAGGSRMIHIGTAQQVEDTTMTRTKKQEGIPVKWEILSTVGNAAGLRMYSIYDITAAASS